MLQFLIDIIFVLFGGRIFQQTVGCKLYSSFCRLVHCSYEADVTQRLLKKSGQKLARSFNFTIHYVDDVLSLNNSNFAELINHIYPIDLETKGTTYTARSALYIDLHLEIDKECRLRTTLYIKRDVLILLCEFSIYMQEHSRTTWM